MIMIVAPAAPAGPGSTVRPGVATVLVTVVFRVNLTHWHVTLTVTRTRGVGASVMVSAWAPPMTPLPVGNRDTGPLPESHSVTGTVPGQPE
jgi:hypothetical protein